MDGAHLLRVNRKESSHRGWVLFDVSVAGAEAPLGDRIHVFLFSLGVWNPYSGAGGHTQGLIWGNIKAFSFFTRNRFCFIFLLFRATPVTYGSSRARGPMGATGASLHHSHSNTGSKLHASLTYTTAQGNAGSLTLVYFLIFSLEYPRALNSLRRWLVQTPSFTCNSTFALWSSL